MNQRSKMLVQLGVMLLVAAGLGGWAWFGVYEHDAKVEKTKAHDEVLFVAHQVDERAADGGAPVSEFTTLTVTAQGQVTQLSRVDGRWRITTPVNAAADSLVIDQLLTQLQTAKFRSKLEEHPTDEQLNSWGLKPAAFTVEASALVNGQARTVSLRGGIDNPFDGSVYMQRNDEPAVYLAEGSVRFALARSTFDLRDKTLVAFDEKEVATFAVTSRANDWQMRHEASGQWFLERPVKSLVDAAIISGMLGTLRQERASAFFDDTAAERTARGLDAPLVDARFTLRDGATQRVQLGQVKSDAGDQFFVRVEADGSTRLAAVTASVRGALDRNPNDIKDHSVLVFDKTAISRITISRDGVSFTVEKASPDASADTWQLVKPSRQAAKIFKISALIYAMGGIKYSAVADEKPKDLKKYGFTPDSKTINFFSGDTEVARLVVGKLVPGQDKQVYVQGLGPTVWETDGSRFSELPWNLPDLVESVDAGP